jgi:PIN domain nuclease of toxin-antitoxin system
LTADVVVIDTHVLLWWLGDEGRLSATARRTLLRASSVLVSPVTFWEVAMLAGKGRIELDRSTVQWANDLLASSRVTEAPLTPQVAVRAAELRDFHGDPADRFIAATAIANKMPLVSKDRLLRGWAVETSQLDCIW